MFDLILATVDRVYCVEKLFSSLATQKSKDFRVVIIDQNDKKTSFVLQKIVKKYRDIFSVKIVSSERGLSRARNAGLDILKGNMFSLTDDDIFFYDDTLECAEKALGQCDIAIGKIVYRNGDFSKGLPEKEKYAKPYRLHFLQEACFQAPSATLFFRREVAEALETHFPEHIGAGTSSPYGSGAETDFLIRAMKKGFRVERHGEIQVIHPEMELAGAVNLTKARRYGLGRYRLIKKYRLGFWFLLLNAAQPLFRMLRKPLNKAHRQFQWQVFLGRIGRHI